MTTYPPLLEVKGLTTRFHSAGKPVRAVDDVSFEVGVGERFGIVGESGSGKTVTALSIMGLIDPPGRIEAGVVRFKGRDLRNLSERQYRQVRGSELALVLQDPLASLNPVMSIGAQLIETIRAHREISKKNAAELAVELLSEVGIPRATDRLGNYPHEFSGGMRQRVGIAMALSCNPELLIADEPTTALDVTIQAQILELLDQLSRERGMAVILITHNLAVVAGFAHHVLVMYAGQVMERADRATLFSRSSHPYTRSLLDSVSRLDRPRSKWFPTIPGAPPSLTRPPSGCPFHPRCFLRQGRDRCHQEQPQQRVVAAGDTPPIGTGTSLTACHFAEELHQPV